MEDGRSLRPFRTLPPGTGLDIVFGGGQPVGGTFLGGGEPGIGTAEQ